MKTQIQEDNMLHVLKELLCAQSRWCRYPTPTFILLTITIVGVVCGSKYVCNVCKNLYLSILENCVQNTKSRVAKVWEQTFVVSSLKQIQSHYTYIYCYYYQHQHLRCPAKSSEGAEWSADIRKGSRQQTHKLNDLQVPVTQRSNYMTNHLIYNMYSSI